MAMDSVEIRYNLPKKGKGLFAKKDISKDEAVFAESPLVCSQFLWNALYKYRACELCMRSMEPAQDMAQRLSANPNLVLPYPECCEVKVQEHTVCPGCQVPYCSQACRDSAWNQYHRSLCQGQSVEDPDHPLNRLQEAWRNMHYPPETASIMLIARMIATVKQACDKELAKSTYKNFCRATVNEEEEIAHKLLGEQFKDQLELLRNMTAEALFEEEVEQWFTPAGFRSLFALIGTNGQGVGSSSISIWINNCEKLSLGSEEKEQLDAFIDQLYSDMDKESGVFLDCEGVGLYALHSSCNHSCVPNARVTFPNNNNVLEVRAEQNIQAGEEIFISYLDECVRERSRHSRQKILRENYLFTCHCQLCLSQADQPDVTSDEEEEEEEEEMEAS